VQHRRVDLRGGFVQQPHVGTAQQSEEEPNTIVQRTLRN